MQLLLAAALRLEVPAFDAIGSGGNYALGALHAIYDGPPRLPAEEIARRACAAAVHFDLSCGGEQDVFTVNAR